MDNSINSTTPAGTFMKVGSKKVRKERRIPEFQFPTARL